MASSYELRSDRSRVLAGAYSPAQTPPRLRTCCLASPTKQRQQWRMEQFLHIHLQSCIEHTLSTEATQRQERMHWRGGIILSTFTRRSSLVLVRAPRFQELCKLAPLNSSVKVAHSHANARLARSNMLVLGIAQVETINVGTHPPHPSEPIVAHRPI